MSIWILAVIVIIAAALAGWRQGAIRAGIIFLGIGIAALLAVPVGHLVHPVLSHLGASNPLTAWALAPITGFILASIPFAVAGQMVHHRAEHFHKYNASELRSALFNRLNTRLGICLGVLNGVAYFILLSFFVYNLTYFTTQASAGSTEQPLTIRMVNGMGDGLQSSGFSRTAAAVGTMPPNYYKIADLAGLLVQNPDLGPRLAEYPGFVSLWHRDDMQTLVTDPIVTNALASGASLGEIAKAPSVQSFFQSKDLTKTILALVVSNLDDLNQYLLTGKSAKYDSEAALGHWQFNANVTLAWFRQDQPKLTQKELAPVRALWSQAYAPMTLQLTADNQLYVKGVPIFNKAPQPNQALFDPHDGQGDWSKDGTNYTLHATINGEDKYFSATTDGIRMRIKDGSKILIFDHVPE